MKYEKIVEQLNSIIKIEKRLLTEEEINFYAKELFKYYRKTGFPNYPILEDKNKIDKFKCIQNIDIDKYYDESTKTFKKYQSLNGFLFAYFPNWISVKCGNGLSLQECWDNDDKLLINLKKSLKWLIPKRNEGWSSNRFRQLSKVYCSSQTVSNFNPVTAKGLYNKYGNQGTILDMSSGWGGRMLGFIGSNCKKYIGYDPCSETFNGLTALKNDYYRLFENEHKEIEIFQAGSETMKLKKNSIDFAFTSPPYFDCEKYSDEETQSYKKFNTKELWTTGFLGETFKRVYKALKPNCYMAINIANTSTHKWLEEACISQAKEIGFVLQDTLYYEISSIAGNGSKREPIFIFKKENK